MKDWNIKNDKKVKDQAGQLHSNQGINLWYVCVWDFPEIYFNFNYNLLFP